jgi:hypothetical protein
MKLKALALPTVALLFLTGCSTAPSPQATVTVTAEAAPTTTSTSAPSEGTSSSLSLDEQFDLYMIVAGTPDWMLEDRESRSILVDQAKTVCSYIADGDSPEDIIWILTLASESSGASTVVTDAFLAASVAATFTYCPQYEGFWE